jgi:hypothetical protein
MNTLDFDLDFQLFCNLIENDDTTHNAATTMRSLVRLLVACLLAVQVVGDEYYQNNDDDKTHDSAYWNTNTDDYSPTLVTCEDGAVEVTSVSILCDSPYTFYYGNGAHRSSQYCSYGDKFSLSVEFSVTENLGYDDYIYITMGIYAMKDNYELLYSVRAINLCGSFVGADCISKGYYSFDLDDTFDYFYSDKNDFYPIIEMGFSTTQDEGYNLGGVNIDCDYDENYEQYDEEGSYTGRSAQIGSRSGARAFAANYGMLLGAIVAITLFALIAWKAAGSEVEYKGTAYQMEDFQTMDQNNDKSRDDKSRDDGSRPYFVPA